MDEFTELIVLLMLPITVFTGMMFVMDQAKSFHPHRSSARDVRVIERAHHNSTRAHANVTERLG